MKSSIAGLMRIALRRQANRQRDLMLGDMPLVLLASQRARRLRLRVDSATRTLILVKPPSISERRALAWASEHRAWAEATLAAVPLRQPFRPGEAINLFGEPHQLLWQPGRHRGVEFADRCLIVGGPEESFEGRVLRALKARALAILEKESRDMATAAGLTLDRVGIGDPRSRWGSCSSQGTIRYSWRLIMAPPFVRQATVAHEVAHLAHLNHGPEFHALAERLLGSDPRPARAWLRREGRNLHSIG